MRRTSVDRVVDDGNAELIEGELRRASRREGHGVAYDVREGGRVDSTLDKAELRGLVKIANSALAVRPPSSPPFSRFSSITDRASTPCAMKIPREQN